MLLFLKKEDKLIEGDNVYVVVSSVQLNQILKTFGHEEKTSTKILIIGGGNIGLMGAISRSVDEHGGVVRGIIPHALCTKGNVYMIIIPSIYGTSTDFPVTTTSSATATATATATAATTTSATSALVVI